MDTEELLKRYESRERDFREIMLSHVDLSKAYFSNTNFRYAS